MVQLTAAALIRAAYDEGFQLVANDNVLEAYGDGPFPANLADQLMRQKHAVLTLLTLRCRRHARDYRAWCGETACANAFPDYLEPDSVDHVTGRLRT